MGRIHTLYYLQVIRSQQDAKREREERRREKLNKSKKKETTRSRGPTKGNVLENRRAAKELEEMLEES